MNITTSGMRKFAHMVAVVLVVSSAVMFLPAYSAELGYTILPGAIGAMVVIALCALSLGPMCLREARNRS